MEINPYLLFDGRCAEAFKFYEKCFGGQIEMMLTHKDLPPDQQVPADWGDKIMHTRMTVGDRVLMGSDAPPDRYETPKGFSVSLSVTSAADAERVFKALAENGTVRMPLQETFWAVRFGMLVDRFGIPWMVNCEKPH